jgi:hypothetical protein
VLADGKVVGRILRKKVGALACARRLPTRMPETDEPGSPPRMAPSFVGGKRSEAHPRNSSNPLGAPHVPRFPRHNAKR